MDCHDENMENDTKDKNVYLEMVQSGNIEGHVFKNRYMISQPLD